jgi:hypothetical protein
MMAWDPQGSRNDDPPTQQGTGAPLAARAGARFAARPLPSQHNCWGLLIAWFMLAISEFYLQDVQGISACRFNDSKH